MHLVSALTAGIKGAENGSATFTLRGTGTPTTVFRDFEGQDPVSSGEAIALDANGGVEIYVDVLTTVTVQSSLGLDVREFVAGYSAPGIELRSVAFTGQAYDDGSGQTIKGTAQPTTLQAIADRWLDVNKGPDWKVPDGSGGFISIPDALASITGLFVNPMASAFGAIGDGANNDLPALDAATLVAAAINGTIVLAHGRFRTVDTWVIPANVNVFGLGANSATIAIDNAANAPAIQISAPPAPSVFRSQKIENFGISADQANSGTVIEVADPGLILRDIIIGADDDNFTGLMVVPTSGDADDHLHLEGCRFNINSVGNIFAIGDLAYTGELRVSGCYMRLGDGFTGSGIRGATGSIESCTFDNTINTASGSRNINVDDSAFCAIFGNHFTDTAGAGTSAITIGALATGLMREAANTTDGDTRPIDTGVTSPEESLVHVPSVRRRRNVNGSGTDLVLDIIDTDVFDYSYVPRTVNTNFSFTLNGVVLDGHRYVVVIRNTTGSNINNVTPPGSSSTFSIGSGKMKIAEFIAVTDGTSVEWLLTGTPYESD